MLRDPDKTGAVFRLQAGPLPCRFELVSIEGKSTTYLLAYLRRLAPNASTGVVFGDDLLYVNLCSLVPEAMLELIRQRRVMLLRQATIPSKKKMGKNTSTTMIVA